MHFPLRRIARASFNCCRNYLTSPAIVLLYHRVAAVECDPQLLCVSPSNFEAHLRLIRENFHPLSLSSLVQGSEAGEIPKNAVVITFDDGYFDNAEFAVPLLEKYEIPATFYISSSMIDSNCEFWWDELEAIFLSGSSLPKSLTLSVGDSLYQWRVNSVAACVIEDSRLLNRWSVLRAEIPTPRHQIYKDLCWLLKSAPLEVRDRVLSELRIWSGTSGTARTTHRAMTAAELKCLGECPFVEIGAHTIDHPSLSALTYSDQMAQIVGSKIQLETLLGCKVQTFSYPYGTSSDYTSVTQDIVRLAGFDSACANYFSWIRSVEDPFQIPRFLVRDWNSAELWRQLVKHRKF